MMQFSFHVNVFNVWWEMIVEKWEVEEARL